MSTLELTRSAVPEGADLSKGGGTAFYEGGRSFRYVPRAHVPRYASCGWREMPSANPPLWSALMYWPDSGAPIREPT